MKITFSILAFLPFYCAGQALFTLVPPEKSGIHFQNTLTESSTQNVLAYEYFYNGGGVAVGDLNNDGLPDIVLTSNQGQPKIYINKGNFVFEDISKQSKVKADGWKTGVTLADVNGDGWLDIYICRSGNGPEDTRRNLLFINQKDGTFKEEAKKYGIDDAGNSTQAVFFDYDNDGDLDLFLLNHSIKRMSGFNVAEIKATRDPSSGDKLYRNDGNGHFTDVSAKAGIIGNSICFGLGASVADFNGDGWPDLYVSNDYDEDDYLYINQKDGTFKESLRDYFGHTSKSTMGCDVADINDDGMSDLFTLDMLPEDNKRQKILVGPDRYNHFQMLLNSGYYYQYMRNMLHLGSRNNNKIQYSEIGQLAGISNTDWSWSALFCDFDLDGWQDLFITNGYWRDYTNMDFIKYTKPAEMLKSLEQGKKPDMYELVKKMPSTELKNYLFKNLGNLTFKNVGKEWGMDLPSFSNGAAYGDFDNDGDWDLVVNNINQPAFIWQNHAEDLKNNYIKFRFKGAGKNPFGIGTKVIVSADDGFKQLQELELVHGFQSSVEPCLIFGLGKRKLVNITVIWQNGKSQTLTQQAVNRTIIFEEDKATDTIPKDVSPHPFFSEEKNDSLFKHVEDDYNDFNREPLLPRQYSKEGPALAKGDVNGDRLIDFYVGGAKGQAGVIYLNNGNGKFEEKKIPAFENDSNYEDVAAAFADFNHDGYPDLYVVSGGNEDTFQDRIYWNDGKGNFSYKPGVLPSTTSTGGTVVAFDFNQDGYPDIFRGGRVLTGSYPFPPASYLFENDHGVFKDVTPDFMKNIGMVSTAEVADINHDGIPDLVLAGEFMPVTILWGQREAPYFTKEKMLQIPNSTGWWNCLKIEDINNDGYPDIVTGNQGLNNQMKPTIEEPVTVDAGDIDNSGTIDAIISYFIQGKSYPMASRDELLAQVPTLKAKFPTYESYSDATVKDIFPPEQYAKAIHLKAEEFRSGVFMNDNGTFHFKPFPIEAQIFPVRDFLIDDFNHDGLKDILLTGNDYAERVQSGRDDAGKGLLLLQSKAGNFLPVTDSGFQTDKDARKLIRIDNSIIVANNNDWLQIFRIN